MYEIKLNMVLNETSIRKMVLTGISTEKDRCVTNTTVMACYKGKIRTRMGFNMFTSLGDTLEVFMTSGMPSNVCSISRAPILSLIIKALSEKAILSYSVDNLLYTRSFQVKMLTDQEEVLLDNGNDNFIQTFKCVEDLFTWNWDRAVRLQKKLMIQIQNSHCQSVIMHPSY